MISKYQLIFNPSNPLSHSLDTTESGKKDYLISLGYTVVNECQIPSLSDFNGLYDAGIYVKLYQNVMGDWRMMGTFVLSKATELEFSSFLIMQPNSIELERIYNSGSKIGNYKSLAGAKKAMTNIINSHKK
jgi:hypothetical protein